MKVRCTHLTSIDKQSYNNWITEGREYHVLSIFYDERKKFFYRIIGDDEITPALFESHLFITISSKIPKNWIVDLKGDIFQLAPKSWMTPGFWEEYFEGNQNARKIFEEEQLIITSCE